MSRPPTPVSSPRTPIRPEERRRRDGEPRGERPTTRGFRAFLEAQSDKTLKLRDVDARFEMAASPRDPEKLASTAQGYVGKKPMEGEALREAREARELREPREPHTRTDDEPRWAPPPPALLPPIERSAPTAPIVGSAQAAAEAATLAERVLSSLRVGRVAGMPEVRMRLGGTRGDVEVRLRLDDGRVVPVLVTDRPAEVAELAERLDALFAERGIDAEQVVIERG